MGDIDGFYAWGKCDSDEEFRFKRSELIKFVSMLKKQNGNKNVSIGVDIPAEYGQWFLNWTHDGVKNGFMFGTPICDVGPKFWNFVVLFK